MTILFAGGELDVYNPASAVCREEVTAGAFDAAFARCAIRCGNQANNGQTTGFLSSPLGNKTMLWTSFSLFQVTGSTGNFGTLTQHFRMINSGGQTIIEAVNSDSGNVNWQFRIWNGTSFQNIGPDHGISFATLTRMTLQVDFPNLTMRVFIGGIPLSTIALPAFAIGYSINLIHWQNISRSTSLSYRLVSEIIIADEPTTAMRVLTIPAVNNGALTQWAGTVTDINEIVLNDATAIVTSNIGDLESFTINTPTISTNFAIRAVCVGARASGNGVSPDDLEALLRIAGVNYFSAPVTLAGTSGGMIFAFNTNPANGSNWAINDLTAANIEFGFAARA